jgi:hypothetical protein
MPEDYDAVKELHDAHEVVEGSDECCVCLTEYPCRVRDWTAYALMKMEAQAVGSSTTGGLSVA